MRKGTPFSRTGGADRRKTEIACVLPAIGRAIAVRFSVIIPTFQRREVVVRMVRALARQTRRDFEVIVVVDGSTDGTAAALRQLSAAFPLTVLDHRNLGAATARNAGAAAARGELLLFLDDDMEADPTMLAEHDRAHQEGADVVLGDLPVHPDSPMTVLTPGVGRWTERRRQLLTTDREVPLSELLTGQMSIAREAFERLGGFDVSFTRGGTFGGEDVDFGYRARRAGLRIVFNPAAVSYQYYDVDPKTYTRRSREAGQAAYELSVKYPERAEELRRGREFTTRGSRVVFGALAIAPSPLSWPLRALAIRLARSPNAGLRSRRLFFAVQTMERRRGLRQGRRRFRTGPAVVLAYHSISDLSRDPVLAEYGVPSDLVAAQLDALSRRGCRFVTLDALLRALDGHEALFAGAVLVTFDDAYADFLTSACPVLTERGIPAAVFVVTGGIGGTNEWDCHLGARELRLLDEEELRSVVAHGFAVGSHGATHRRLVNLDPSELQEELLGSAERLSSIGVPRPAAFSYPHGVWSPDVSAAVEEAGYAAAFTVSPGVVATRADRYALPRIEVFASDTPRKLRLKVAVASWPERRRRRLLRLLRVRI